MNDLLDLFLRWESAAVAVAATILGLAVARLYRTSALVYGAPTSMPRREETAPGYRDPSCSVLSPYHAAYLMNPRLLPGLVAVAPLFSRGVLGVERWMNRITAGGATASLDRFQQLAVEQGVGNRAWAFFKSLSIQMGPPLEDDLRGSALQSPPGGRGVPRAANGCLWLTALGLVATLISLAGAWGGVGGSVILIAAFRAHRFRSLAGGASLSRAGWEVLREQERLLEQRIDGLKGDEFDPEDVAWYVALKPVPHGWLPGLDDRFLPFAIGEAPLGIPIEIGPKLTAAELETARRNNRRRSLGFWSIGSVAFGLGVSTLLAVEASPVLWLNLGLALVVGVRVALGVREGRRARDWVRNAAPRFYGLRAQPRR